MNPQSTPAALAWAFFWFFAGLTPMVLGMRFGLIGMAIGGGLGVAMVGYVLKPDQAKPASPQDKGQE